MKKLAAVILILILSFAAVMFFLKKHKNILEVKVIRVKGGSITSTVSASGKVISTNTIKISSKTGGKIIYLAKSEGDNVKAGELIAKIDSAELETQMKQQLANLTLAKARYNQIKKGARKQEIEAAKSVLLSAKANFEETDKNLKRIKTLYQDNFATEQQLDVAKSRRDTTEAQMKQAEEQLELISNRTTSDDIAIQEAQIKQAEAALEVIKLQIKNTYIYSPISGKILQKYLNANEIVSPSMPILTIASTDSIVIEANVDETEIGKIKEGNKVLVSCDAYPNKNFEGKLYYIADESLDVKEVGITFPCRIKLISVNSQRSHESLNPFRIGMSIDVEIISDTKTNAIYIPTDCLIEENEKNFVYVIKDDKVSKRKIKEGISNDDFIEITQGLEKGEIVVLNNLDKLKEGMKVKFKKQE